jgi:hypothetical protein
LAGNILKGETQQWLTKAMTNKSVNNDPLKSGNKTEGDSDATCVSVNAGICGFNCRVRAWKTDKRALGLAVSESECRQIQAFSETLQNLTLKDVFMPTTRNPVYLAAERSGCHPSCVVPAAVLKTAEVALEMALARDAIIRFESCK